MSTFDPEAWEKAETNVDGSNTPPEPGYYEVTVTDARAFTAKSENDIVVVEFQVLAGADAGYTWSGLYGFKSQGAVGATKAICEGLGVDTSAVSSLEELDGALKAVAVGGYYGVKVVQNGEYRNTYVNDRLPSSPAEAADVPADTEGLAGSDDAAESSDPVPDEEIPF